MFATSGSCSGHDCSIGPCDALPIRFFPVMIDSALLVIAGAIYSNMTEKIPQSTSRQGLELDLG